ncbi:MAG: [acyl-carrier-protein] S-malonyltransferase [Burkholderiales bacterium]|nr:MAG: [acyl-carrier-protein] S-malonyltransferase [Burkholderiales bacterium]TAG77184.1 MAG: [acyl-carrier-protein] S-malonyltransferase [Betaproteobacteria bacterium]
MKLAFVFPGQGSQSVGMMAGYAGLDNIDETLAAADAALASPLSALMANGPESELNITTNTQPAMLASDIAVWNAWVAAGGAFPSLVAGHSLGEYAALVVAGVVKFPDAMKLVKARAEAMQSAVPAGIGAMAAVLGLEPDQLAKVCEQAAQGEVVSMCNLNAPGQIVIGGHKAAVERAMAAAKEVGAKRALLLPMSVPSHCELMRPAAEQFANALNATNFAAPQIGVIHNATVDVAGDAAAIRLVLAEQIFKPVRWIETIQKMAAHGVTHIVECGPGKVLSGMVKRIAPEVKCYSLSDKAAFDAALTELKG